MDHSSIKIYVINCTTLHHAPIENKYQVELCIYFGLTILLAMATTTANSLIIFATIKQKSKFQADILLVYLSYTDFISGLSLLIWFLNFVIVQRHFHCCSFYLISVALGYVVGFGCVCFSFMMTFERYLTIFYPFTYEKVMNTRYEHVNIFAVFCGTVWLIFIFLIIIPYFNESFEGLKPAIVVFLPLSITLIVILNIRIYFHVRKVRTSIKKIKEICADPIEWVSSNQKLLRGLLAISVSLILPVLCTIFDTGIARIFLSENKIFENGMMYLWGTFSVASKSLINPCLYIYSLKQIRKSVPG